MNFNRPLNKFLISRRFLSQSYKIFDQNVKIKQQKFAWNSPNRSTYDYIHKKTLDIMYDRRLDIKRDFDKILFLGRGFDHLINHLDTEYSFIDFYSGSVENHNDLPENIKIINKHEEEVEFESNNLHWINDLPGIFRRILNGLQKDGCFLGTMFSSDTLFELRVSLQLAETERHGGIAAHISPFATNVDIGDLLHMAGFNLITLDVEERCIYYPSMFELVEDIRNMGEQNCNINRPLRLSRDTLYAANAIYIKEFGTKREAGEEQCIPATFRFLNFIAWKPDPSQLQPLPRGSATHSLKDIDKIDEILTSIEKTDMNK